MDKNHKDILKQVKEYLDAPLTEDEISANNYTYFPAKSWFMPNINELTNDKETILAINDLLEEEKIKQGAIYVKKYGWGGDSPWSGRMSDSLFMSEPENAHGVKSQKINDCQEQLKLPGLINAIKYSWEMGGFLPYLVGALILLSMIILFTNSFQGSGGSSSDDDWFCQYDDPINKKGKTCYRDSNGDGIPDEEW